jgi:hypothetical protein
MNIPEYQPQRHTLGEAERKCSCKKMMKRIDFSSHPIADQVWMDWECKFCGKKLYLRYFDDYLNKRIEVTERKNI